MMMESTKSTVLGSFAKEKKQMFVDSFVTALRPVEAGWHIWIQSFQQESLIF